MGAAPTQPWMPYSLPAQPRAPTANGVSPSLLCVDVGRRNVLGSACSSQGWSGLHLKGTCPGAQGEALSLWCYNLSEDREPVLLFGRHSELTTQNYLILCSLQPLRPEGGAGVSPPEQWGLIESTPVPSGSAPAPRPSTGRPQEPSPAWRLCEPLELCCSRGPQSRQLASPKPGCPLLLLVQWLRPGISSPLLQPLNS